MSDPIKRLQIIAREAALHINPDSRAKAVIIIDANGDQIVRINVQGSNGGHAASLKEEPTPIVESGWSERNGKIYFDGTPIPLAGRQLDLLRVLIEKESATVDELRPAWKGSIVEESTIRWTVGELKKSLKKLFGDFPGDLIKSSGEGYSLQLR